MLGCLATRFQFRKWCRSRVTSFTATPPAGRRSAPESTCAEALPTGRSTQRKTSQRRFFCANPRMLAACDSRSGEFSQTKCSFFGTSRAHSRSGACPNELRSRSFWAASTASMGRSSSRSPISRDVCRPCTRPVGRGPDSVRQLLPLGGNEVGLARKRRHASLWRSGSVPKFRIQRAVRLKCGAISRCATGSRTGESSACILR
mmetsp:Transcript_34067/g.95818  ORF Transcript_34067/g.95818 Transcript_34067/m.95818 type:complete len:203 (+) Transcript_34067:464-1072(+)